MKISQEDIGKGWGAREGKGSTKHKGADTLKRCFISLATRRERQLLQKAALLKGESQLSSQVEGGRKCLLLGFSPRPSRGLVPG